ncbi:minor capsid protein [Peptococcus simiae]|uniref:minor capsid protein n=1 Tax=Peptococcus simiae TaxID=1643805 RepID=UPI0039812B28
MTVQSIARTYDQALRQIDTEMYSHLSKMADKNHLSPQKAAEALSRGELAGYRMDLETFARRARQAGALTSQMERELDNASRRVRISRLQAAKDTLRREMQLFYSSYDKDLADHLKKQYSDTYRATLTGLKDTAFITMPHIDMTLSRLDAAIRKPWAVDGLTFSQRLWKDQATLVNTLHQTLSRQVALSLAPDETVKALVGAFPEKTMRSAIGRLVMTESNAIATAGTQEAYKATGVKQYEIVATLDSKISTICQEMDGKRFPTSKMEIGATAPPFHPWCRTTTAPYDPDFDDLLPDGPRAARDADGKTYLTNARTYKEWVTEGQEEKTSAAMDPMKAKKATISFIENGATVSVSAKFVRKTKEKHNIWVQDKLHDGSKLAHQVDKELRYIEQKYNLKDLPPLMVTDNNFLRGKIGGYHKADKAIYLPKNLIRNFDPESVKHTTAKSLNDVILHEIGHYYHWKAVEKFYKRHAKRYNSLIEAKEYLEKDILLALSKASQEELVNVLSEYASSNWRTNEPYAEWFTLFIRDGGTQSARLDKLFKEVFRHVDD